MILTLHCVISAANIALCAYMLRYSVRKQSLTIIIWALCTVFGLTVLCDGIAAPVVLTIGAKLTISEGDVVLKGAFFMLLFNAGMALSQLLVFQLASFPRNRQYLLDTASYPQHLRLWLNVMTGLFVIASITYMARLTTYGTYDDRYKDTASNWEMVIMVACWSTISLALVFRRHRTTTLVIVITLLVTALAKVRYFTLFFVAPALVFVALRVISKRKQRGPKANARVTFGPRTKLRQLLALAIAVLALLTLGTYIRHVRNPSIIRSPQFDLLTALPEVWLTKGYYGVIQSVDSGLLDLGFLSYRRMVAGMAWPYHRLLGENRFETDVPVYIANVLGGFSLADFQHWPCLIYADAYIAGGAYGWMLGLLWGLIYTVLDLHLTFRPVFVIFLPYVIWFYYMTYRGAVANSVVSIPREIYINLVILIAVSTIPKWPRVGVQRVLSQIRWRASWQRARFGAISQQFLPEKDSLK